MASQSLFLSLPLNTFILPPFQWQASECFYPYHLYSISISPHLVWQLSQCLLLSLPLSASISPHWLRQASVCFYPYHLVPPYHCPCYGKPVSVFILTTYYLHIATLATASQWVFLFLPLSTSISLPLLWQASECFYSYHLVPPYHRPCYGKPV